MNVIKLTNDKYVCERCAYPAWKYLNKGDYSGWYCKDCYCEFFFWGKVRNFFKFNTPKRIIERIRLRNNNEILGYGQVF